MEVEFFTNTNHKLSDNSTRATVTSSSYYQNVFGNVIIDSLSNECHCWQYKIIRNKESYGIDIGIIEYNHLDSESSFTSTGFGYGLCSNGSIYSAHCTKRNYKLKNCKQKYKNNDLVLMTLDLNSKTLSFFIDHYDKNKQQLQKKIIIKHIKINENIKYRMAVYLSYKKDSIQLLNHIKTINKINNKINTSKVTKQPIKQLICNYCDKYEQIVNDLKCENNKLKDSVVNNDSSTNNESSNTESEGNEEYKNQITILQNELVIKNTEMNELYNMIKQKDLQLTETQNQLKTLQIKLDEFQMNNNNNNNNKNDHLLNKVNLKETEKENEKQIQAEIEKEKEKNKLKCQVIKSDESWRIDLKKRRSNNKKKRRRSVMALEQNKAVSRRLSSAQNLIST